MEFFGAEKQRYETKRINAELPLEYRAFLWMLISRLQNSKVVSMDYLQIFEFSYYKEKDGYMQVITHQQEQPEYQADYKISLAETTFEKQPIQGKVYCIDDGEQCTMLWAEEY